MTSERRHALVNGLFARALLAFLILPGTVAFLVPLVLIAPAGTGSSGYTVGLVPLALGIAILLGCVREFYVAGRGTLAPWEPPQRLVASGLYRFARNPMYVGVLLILCGWAVRFGSWRLALYAGAIALLFHLRVVYHEEPYLARTHGEEWTRYRARVPRWIGRPRGASEAEALRGAPPPGVDSDHRARNTAMATERTALIVGAGIGGLAAGLALGRAGWGVRIVERRASTRELGFALSLAPNAMLALRELGVADRVVADGAVAGLTEIRGAGGRPLKRFDVAAALGQVPAVFALREVVHGALVAATDPRTLSLESEADGFEITRNGVVLTLADGRTESGDALIGADGVASAVRRGLHPAEPPPRASGYYGLRGVAYGATEHLGGLSAAAYMVPGIEAATLKAGRDAVYWYMSLLAGDVADAREDPRAVAERCASALDAAFRAILRATAPEDIRLDALWSRDPIERWGRGVVTLLGDAAHPMLPHTGQGAAQALEDAVALGLALAPGSDVAASLRRYERIRARRTRRIVLRGPRIARLTTTRNPILGWVRAAAIRMAPPKLMAGAFLLAERTDPHAALRGRGNT